LLLVFSGQRTPCSCFLSTFLLSLDHLINAPPTLCVIHCRDAAALAEFWCWLEEEVHKKVALTEVQVAENLLEFRRKQDGFIETSFDTISGMCPRFVFSSKFSLDYAASLFSFMCWYGISYGFCGVSGFIVLKEGLS
jgi:hypothetical protein